MPDTPVLKCYKCLSLIVTQDYMCPKCGSEDLFPYRLYQCPHCGHVADQDTWFPKSEGDVDPLDTDLEPELCGKCGDDISLAELTPVPASPTDTPA